NNNTNQTTDQDLVAQLLKSLANPSGLHSGKGLSRLLHEPQKLLNGGMVNGNENSEKILAYLLDDQQNTPRVTDQHVQLPDSEIPRKGLYPANSRGSEIQDSHQSSPPQTSGNSDSASAQSPSSFSGEAHSCTDRIVFKLFGKEPSDFPIVLRGKILNWLAHSPTEIESYIKPGCIILTVYLRLAESSWEEVCSDLSSRLTRLFAISDDTFWRTGWVYV
uniref:Uncharacterized protein n=1 Tax=Chenopodium quinoa TaxID=63459 RepID=A0A803M794_CHEQI